MTFCFLLLGLEVYQLEVQLGYSDQVVGSEVLKTDALGPGNFPGMVDSLPLVDLLLLQGFEDWMQIGDWLNLVYPTKLHYSIQVEMYVLVPEKVEFLLPDDWLTFQGFEDQNQIGGWLILVYSASSRYSIQVE